MCGVVVDNFVDIDQLLAMYIGGNIVRGEVSFTRVLNSNLSSRVLMYTTHFCSGYMDLVLLSARVLIYSLHANYFLFPSVPVHDLNIILLFYLIITSFYSKNRRSHCNHAKF